MGVGGGGERVAAGQNLLDPAVTAVDIASARVRRRGEDITLVTYGGSLFKTLDAAAALAQDGIEAEVIDLRSLRPLDMATVVDSVAKTRRVVIVDEGWKSGSISAEIAMRIMRKYGFSFVAAWEGTTNRRTEFIYVLAWPDEATKNRAWEAFRADTEWAEIKRVTTAEHGTLVGEIGDRTLAPTDYSPPLPA